MFESKTVIHNNNVFHTIRPAEFSYAGLHVGSSQFLQLTQLPQNLMFDTKIIKKMTQKNLFTISISICDTHCNVVNTECKGCEEILLEIQCVSMI
jgi:hypothetical protein